MDYSDLNELIAETESPLYQKFNKASEYVNAHHDTVLPNDLLDIYAFYKQSLVGDCNVAKPGIFQMTSRAKWSAWNALRGMSNDDAMQKYIEKVESLFPQWHMESGTGDAAGGGTSWVATSRPANDTEIGQTLTDFVQDGNLEQVKQFLGRLTGEEVNELDEHGMGLIHWCTDRGHEDLLKVILAQPGVDVNLRDGDSEQTALHYASSCGHLGCLRILVEAGADHNAIDVDGNSILDVAYDVSVADFVKEVVNSQTK